MNKEELNLYKVVDEIIESSYKDIGMEFNEPLRFTLLGKFVKLLKEQSQPLFTTEMIDHIETLLDADDELGRITRGY